jgi:hypothetical protein
MDGGVDVMAAAAAEPWSPNREWDVRELREFEEGGP